MSFDPILTAEPIIQAHICLALVALLAGPFAMFRTRRDRLHKVAGYLAAGAIVGVALTSLGIKRNNALIAHFGPIHLLSILAIWGISEAMYFIYRGNVARHQASMFSTWFGALGLAGLFTLLPGRTMNRAMFGEPSMLGYAVIGVGLVGLARLWRNRQRFAGHRKSSNG